MRQRQAVIVGIFFFVGIAALLWLTRYADDEHQLFGRKPKVSYRARFESAVGLRMGDPVYVLGLKAGNITDTRIVEDDLDSVNLVEVKFEVEQDYALTRGATARIQMTSLMGGKMLSITPGRSNSPALPTGSLIPSEDALDIDSLVASATQALTVVSDTVDEVRPALAKSVQNIERITGGVDPDKVSEIVEDVRQLASRLREVSEKINEGKGTIARLINDEEMSADVKDTFTDLAATVKNIRDVAENVSEGQGTLGLLLQDPETADKVKEIITSARDIAVNISEGKGTLGLIINEPDLYNTINNVADDISKVTGQLTSTEGTLGAIINDPEIYLELKRLLTESREAIEDAREQAPLTAFGSLVFGFIQ